MSLNRYAAKRDAAEPAIIAALEKAGCLVKQGNWVDLVVQRAGTVWLLEVKSHGGTLTGAQKALIAGGWEVRIVRSAQEALKAVGL